MSEKEYPPVGQRFKPTRVQLGWCICGDHPNYMRESRLAVPLPTRNGYGRMNTPWFNIAMSEREAKDWTNFLNDMDRAGMIDWPRPVKLPPYDVVDKGNMPSPTLRGW